MEGEIVLELEVDAEFADGGVGLLALAATGETGGDGLLALAATGAGGLERRTAVRRKLRSRR